MNGNRDYEVSEYAIALQRAIEAHCHGRMVDETDKGGCPWHAKMLNRHVMRSAERLAETLRECLADYSHPSFTDRHGMADRIRQALAAHSAQAQPPAQSKYAPPYPDPSDEWAVVPRVPTKAMIDACCKIKLDRLEALRDGHGASSGIVAAAQEEWDAMIAAAPRKRHDRQEKCDGYCPVCEDRATIRAELLRLADENETLERAASKHVLRCIELQAILDTVLPKERAASERAEKAEAELAALRARLFHGIVLDVDDLVRGHAGLPLEWRGKRVRLVVED